MSSAIVMKKDKTMHLIMAKQKRNLFIGLQDPFRCDVYSYIFPITVIIYIFVMLSVEKFIGYKYALRYKAIITHGRIY